MLYRRTEHGAADATHLEIKFGLNITEPNAWGHCWILYHETNTEASTVLCPVVKHQEQGENPIPTK